MSVRLSDLMPCFQGIIPSLLSTCDAAGEPNCTYLSHVYYVDEHHVALSCQFFNKTKRNVAENPRATVVLHDPVSFQTHRLLLRFDHSEIEGPLFETMSLRIDVIASHTGMTGVFRLLSADVYEVLEVETIEEFLVPVTGYVACDATELPPGPLNELRALQTISDRIARANDLETLIDGTFTALDEKFGFSHSMLMVPCEKSDRLVTLATRGYGESGVGSEVALGQGVIGYAAQRRRVVRVTGMGMEIAYGRAVRDRVQQAGGAADLCEEIPLPGLPDAQAQLALPLLIGDRLVGVLAMESRDPLCFDEWDEALLQILGTQIAMGIDRMHEDEEDAPSAAQDARPRSPSSSLIAMAVPRTFTWFAHDESMFVDGEYLVRNVPGKILLKILRTHRDEGRMEFSNRELRMDPALGLPPLKDNLESRLILLRKRLEQKLGDVRIEPLRRGQFALRLERPVELVEKATV
jgi:adenylate cyclase